MEMNVNVARPGGRMGLAPHSDTPVTTLFAEPRSACYCVIAKRRTTKDALGLGDAAPPSLKSRERFHLARQGFPIIPRSARRPPASGVGQRIIPGNADCDPPQHRPRVFASHLAGLSPTVPDAGPLLPRPHSGGISRHGMRVSRAIASSKRIAGGHRRRLVSKIGQNPHASVNPLRSVRCLP